MSDTEQQSEVSTSILRDPKYLWVLAWLDRAGLTTDEAIATNLSLEVRHVNQILLDLHHKDLVEYNDKWLRISDAGKEVLDNLGLDEQVLLAIIKQLRIPAKYTKIFSSLIQQYRDSSHRGYLDTLCSVNAFTRYQEYFLAPESRSKEYNEFIDVARLAIWIRDLRNWMTHSIGGLSTRRYLESAKVESHPFAIIIQDRASLHRVKFSRVRSCLRLLDWNAEFLETENDPQTGLESTDKSLYWKIFLSFNDLQRCVKRESWFSSWIDLESSLLKHSWKREVANIHFYCRSLLQREQSFQVGKMSSWWFPSMKNYLKPSVTGSSCNVVGQLFCAESIEEFGADLGLSIEEAEMLVRRIYSKSRTLLEKTKKP